MFHRRFNMKLRSRACASQRWFSCLFLAHLSNSACRICGTQVSERLSDFCDAFFLGDGQQPDSGGELVGSGTSFESVTYLDLSNSNQLTARQWFSQS